MANQDNISYLKLICQSTMIVNNTVKGLQHTVSFQMLTLQDFQHDRGNVNVIVSYIDNLIKVFGPNDG